LVRSAKFFFDKFSTFNMFYLGAYQIPGGTPVSNNQVQDYDCVSTGTQEMPPSWTDTTDPNAALDTQGRVYQTMLPFNAFWDASTLHPDGAIDMSFSDDLGQHSVDVVLEAVAGDVVDGDPLLVLDVADLPGRRIGHLLEIETAVALDPVWLRRSR
jgi:hypothetical protein